MDKVAFGIVIGLLFVTLIMAFCVLLIRLYFTKIKAYTAQLYQKDIDFQKTLNTTIVETQEQVLNNISQDLHDDAGQQLTYINLQLEHIKLDAPELMPLLQPVSQSVAALSESIRSISHALNNQLITQQDLLKAIENDMQRLNKNKGTQFKVSAPTHPIALPTDHKIVIYRMFQEIVNNILKHAKAGNVQIDIATRPFLMRVSDNGKGFDPAVASQQQSMGLQNLIARAALIGYAISIVSAPGEGTVITLTAPNHQ
ncbi:ATP-binding protein [Flavobacterium sp.]|uniref:sensor histidine kinase n=1 Tax=Flavobacterium sp. TaxID=239 RepID=UPI00261456A8|nr:ATP-binding protein [Flavobacterium sp.]